MANSIEKSPTRKAYDELIEPALTALALLSLAVACAGGLWSAVGASWRVRAYFSLAALLFDLLLSMELLFLFFVSLRRSFAPPPLALVAAGLSSLAPLAFVSGPLLFGWAAADFSVAAVRGFASVNGAAAALSAFAGLRLLRAFRPFLRLSSAQRERLDKKSGFAALAALIVLMAGGMLGDGLLIPSIARTEAQRRGAVLEAFDRQGPVSIDLGAQPDIVALRRGGQAASRLEGAYNPSDASYMSYGGAEAWFELEGFHKARGAAEALAVLVALAFALSYALAAKRERRSRAYAAQIAARSAGGDQPAGQAELAGILGKKLP
jgi:hypothetical protein